jgi:hypothetical protein
MATGHPYQSLSCLFLHLNTHTCAYKCNNIRHKIQAQKCYKKTHSNSNLEARKLVLDSTTALKCGLLGVEGTGVFSVLAQIQICGYLKYAPGKTVVGKGLLTFHHFLLVHLLYI